MNAKGFSLIEVLVVIGIMALLISALAFYSYRASYIKVQKAVTICVMDNANIAMNTYYNEFRSYPPDGYDEPVFAPNGLQLKGSACLTYYLAWLYPDGKGGLVEITEMTRPDYVDSGQPRRVEVNKGSPFWTSFDSKKRFNQYGEVLDGFGNPLRYDNCKSGYTPNPHPMNGARDPDPREVENGGKPYCKKSYDLWSCGPDGGMKDATTRDDITPD